VAGICLRRNESRRIRGECAVVNVRSQYGSSSFAREKDAVTPSADAERDLHRRRSCVVEFGGEIVEEVPLESGPVSESRQYTSFVGSPESAVGAVSVPTTLIPNSWLRQLVAAPRLMDIA
jgi:hypothetical protein